MAYSDSIPLFVFQEEIIFNGEFCRCHISIKIIDLAEHNLYLKKN